MSGACLIAGTHSGCGKTTVSLALMAALRARGIDLRPFKCGPDFIDPTLHSLVTGRVSRNLDLRMCGPDFVRTTFSRHQGAESMALVEGVMGLFDGGLGSAASLARCLDIPVVLVVDVRSAAESVAALIHGFETLDPGLTLCGVILNRVGSDRHRRLICDAVHAHCKAEVIGVLGRDEALTIPARHLGLHMDSDQPLSASAIHRLVEWMEQGVDIDRLLALGQGAGPAASQQRQALEPVTGSRVRMGVARDTAFCFYYQDNLDLLTALGAELVPFSPATDAALPRGLDGLYFGGGYPELHAAQLAANRGMQEDIRAFAGEHRPVYAECGGFMYLTRALTDLDGVRHPMVGLFAGEAIMHRRLQRLGYQRVRQVCPTLFGPAGTMLHGHEFHYSSLLDETILGPGAYQLDDGRVEGYQQGRVLGGYVHLHWGGTPEAASCLVRACQQS
jgi:cobyrinic acid a,c-diamide synthase